MVITPIASAYSHCSVMLMSGYLSERQTLSIVVLADNTVASNHHGHDQGHHQNQSDRLCQASGSCTFHVCGGYGITSSSSTIDVIASYSFSNSESSSPYSTAFSPEIRPPILILKQGISDFVVWDGISSTKQSTSIHSCHPMAVV